VGLQAAATGSLGLTAGRTRTGAIQGRELHAREEDVMNEPIAASSARRLTAEIALSALPDAPARTEPTPRKRPVAPHLHRLSARLLVGLAHRLDPNAQIAN
jgi:hypothetical protein